MKEKYLRHEAKNLYLNQPYPHECVLDIEVKALEDNFGNDLSNCKVIVVYRLATFNLTEEEIKEINELDGNELLNKFRRIWNETKESNLPEEFLGKRFLLTSVSYCGEKEGLKLKSEAEPVN